MTETQEALIKVAMEHVQEHGGRVEVDNIEVRLENGAIRITT